MSGGGNAPLPSARVVARYMRRPNAVAAAIRDARLLRALLAYTTETTRLEREENGVFYVQMNRGPLGLQTGPLIRGKSPRDSVADAVTYQRFAVRRDEHYMRKHGCIYGGTPKRPPTEAEVAHTKKIAEGMARRWRVHNGADASTSNERGTK